MKILVVSDIESKFIWDHFDPERFRDVRLIISCGDLSARYLSFLVTMIPCPLLYVPGNHDKRYEINPPEGCVNIDGKVVVYKGIRIMGLGGCKSPRPTTYEYSEEQMWRRVRKIESQIRRAKGLDLFVTHAPAIGLGDGPDLFHEGFQAFRYIDDIYKPDIHFYGHRHLGRRQPRRWRRMGRLRQYHHGGHTGLCLRHVERQLQDRILLHTGRCQRQQPRHLQLRGQLQQFAVALHSHGHGEKQQLQREDI